MTNDYPLIAYDNLLSAVNAGTALYSVTAGTDNTAAPITNVANANKLLPALPLVDVSGNFTVVFQLQGSTAAQVFIMGADRHDAAGFKTTGGFFSLEYWDGAAYQSLIASTAVTAQDTATIYKLPTHTLGLNGSFYEYRLSYTGYLTVSTLAIPELFLGTVLEMPPMDLNFDEYNEVFRGSKFESLAGRPYKTLHYRRVETPVSWSALERSLFDTDIRNFRENALELLKSFWFAWQPDTSPNEVYLMYHDADSAGYPILSAIHRRFSLKLVEDL